MTPAQEAIVRAAQAAGENPAYALAVAERESNFNPRAHSSKTIHGMYQMRGDLRAKYGAGDSEDPEEQARGWTRSLPDIRAAMRQRLGRDPTDQEAYLGHHFGAGRAARTLQMDPSTPVDAVFTPQEMALNPHFGRAGTIGRLNSSVMGDIDKRMTKFGGVAGTPSQATAAAPSTSPVAPADLSSFGTATENSGGTETQPRQNQEVADLSSFGHLADVQTSPADGPATGQSARPDAAELADLSSFGTAVS